MSLLAVFGLLLAGCTDAPEVEQGPAPGCGNGEVTVSGTVAGEMVAVRHREQGHSFTNALGDSRGTLDMTTNQGALSLEFDELVPNGGSTSAFGWARRRH